MSPRNLDTALGPAGARESGVKGYDHIDPADIEEALTPLREAIIQIRRHVEADAPRLNKVIERRQSRSPLQSEIRDALRETGPRDAWDENVVLDVLVYAGMTVTGASYILYSIGRLLYSPVSLRAVEVLARTTLEMSARAWWLLAPDIRVRERVQRALGEELHTSRQELTALRKGDFSELTEAGSWRIDTTLNFARSLGIPLKHDRRGREILDGFVRPSATTLIEEFATSLGVTGRGASVYGWLSGSIHGDTFHLVDLVEGRPTFPHTKLSSLGNTLTVPVLAFREAHLRLAAYIGDSSSASRVQPYNHLTKILKACIDSQLPVGIY